jgi:outer membrane usher protein
MPKHRIQPAVITGFAILIVPTHALAASTTFGAAQAVNPIAAAAGGSSIASPPIAPPARQVRLNPTGRPIVLTVPLKDGATYLGDIPLTIGADDTLLFPADRLFQLLTPIIAPDALDTLRSNFAGKTQLSPEDLAPTGLNLAYNPRTLELVLTIPVERRASRDLSVSALDRARLGSFYQPASASAYLNVRGTFDLVETGPDTGFADPILFLDGAVRLGSVVAESDAIWSPGRDSADFQRLGSRLVYDDIAHLIRFSAGDLRPQVRGFQATPEIAGVALSRSYSVLNPQQVIRPRGDRTFRLERPSTVEVVVNGQQVRRVQLAPGTYNLRDFPFAQGGNDVRLNVLDDTGRREVLQFNIFLDQTQLAKGLSEFGLYAGVKAPLEATGPNYSNDWIATGFVRHGISDAVTLGANFQADAQIQMGGGEAMFGTPLGSFGTHLAYSHTKGFGDGFAVQGTFQRLVQHGDGQSDSFNLFAEHRSRKFAPVTFYLAENQYDFEAGGGYTHAFSAEFYAGVDGRYSKGRATVPDLQSYRAFTGWRLTPLVNLSTEFRYNQDSRGKEYSGFLTLTINIGRSSSLRSEYDTRENRVRMSYQTLHGSGVGSYTVTADAERSDLGSTMAVNASYFANRAELGFSHYGNFAGDFGTSISQRSSFRLGTSIAMADGAVSIGRPIYDSFAIIKPHRSLAKGEVLVEPSPFGYTANSGALGAATLPSLSSYAERTIPVDVAGAPVGIDIGQGSFKVFPAYRSGYVLQVGSDYNLTVMGTMIDRDGQPISLMAGQATELAHPDRPPVTLFTNRIGRFGATGLAPGKWRIEMLDQAKSVYLVTIPEDATGIVRVGEITPEKDR